MQIEFDDIIKRASICLKNKLLPNHDAFTISEVVGAVTGIPKEIVLDKMMDVGYNTHKQSETPKGAKV